MKTSTLMACALLTAGICRAIDFPSAGGDIASDGADGWNGAKPGSGEEAKFTQAGTYTASGNVTFGSVNFASDGLVFDLRSGNRAVTLDGATPVVGPSAANATTHLKGGSWSGTGMTFKSIGDGYTLLLSDGVSITDAGTLSLGHSLKNNSVILTGGSEIHAATILSHRWGGTNAKLDVGDGSKVYSTGAFMVQQNGSVNFVGNHLVDVHGVGSLLQAGGDLNFGQWNSDNVVRVRDGAALSVESTGVEFSGGGRHLLEVLNMATATVGKVSFNRADNRLTVSNAVLNATTINLGNSTYGQGGNVVQVLDDATATVGTVAFRTCGNSFVVSNATCTVNTDFQLGNAAAVTGNVMRVVGSEAVFNRTGNVFGAGCGNLFELADGATWRLGGADILAMMNGGSNNVLRVTGGAVLDNTSEPAGNSNFWLNYNDTTWENNTLEVLDGATVNVERLFVHGVGTKIVVSNATLSASSADGYGIWLGRGSGSAGQKLIVRGTIPAVRLAEFKSSSGSTIRFEVPAEGYAEGYVPMTATKIDSNLNTSTEKFEIDYAAWAANPDAVRKLVLLRTTTTDITSAQADWIIAQNPGIPEGIRLKVTSREVILQKRDGFILSFR